LFIYNVFAVKKFIDIFNRPIDDVQLVSLMPHFNAYFVLNYLAHIYLSGSSLSVQVGNFIGDFVKGKQMDTYPSKMRQGMVMHRKIDHFTDQHPVVKGLVALLRPEFGRYSAIVADMYFDYFLAKNFKVITGGCSLTLFVYRFYMGALLRYGLLPERVRGFIFHFVGTNRLGKYAHADGLQDSLEIMARYKVSALDPHKIVQYLKANEMALKRYFDDFFPDLQKYCHQIR
jgi:acyl carrier protein phosphodiesterase